MSFGTIGLAVGSVLLISGFLGYFNFIPGSDNSLSSLLLIYGFPITLIGTHSSTRLSSSPPPPRRRAPRPAPPQASR